MVLPQATALSEYALCVCVVLTYISLHCISLIRGKEEEGRTTSVSQVITLRLAIHSGIALIGLERSSL